MKPAISNPARQFYEFGPFRLDPLKRLLLRGGSVVPLTPKAFDILLALIENRGEVMEKDQLMRTVWPDSVVEENNLTRNISALRKALGERVDEHRYVVTIPGRGYRFVAAVRELVDDAVDPTMDMAISVETTGREMPRTPDSMPAKPRNARLLGDLQRRRAALIAVMSMITLVGIAVGLRNLPSRKQTRAEHPEAFLKVRPTRLTNTGNAPTAAISPDGKYIAYVLNEGSRQSLWVRHTATASHVRVVPPAVVDYWGLTFTRGGDYVYYVIHEWNKTDPVLHRVAVLGGVAPQRVLGNLDNTISFSPDGRRFAYTEHSSFNAESVLKVANTDGSGEQRIAVRKAPEFFSLNPNAGPSWSPDGHVIVSAAGTLGQDGRSLVEVRVADGTQRPLGSRRWAEVKQTCWLADGSGLVMIAKDEASSPLQLWFLSYPGCEARRITNDLLDYRNVSVTADSRTLVTAQSETVSSIWVASEAKGSPFKQLTSGVGKLSGDDGLAWTRGGRIVYRSDASGQSELWMAEVGGGGAKQLTVNGKVKGPISVSSDGRSLIFSSNRTGNHHIWHVGMDGGNPRQLTEGSGEIHSHVSPDGRWLIYQQERQSFRHTLWKIPIDGGETIRLTNESAMRPAVSPDGKWIAYFYMDISIWGIAVIPFAGGEPLKRFRIPSSVTSRVARWTPDGKAVAYIDDRDGVSNIWLQPLNGGAPRQHTDFKEGQIFYFDWSRDGRQLALSRGTLISDVLLISEVR